MDEKKFQKEMKEKPENEIVKKYIAFGTPFLFKDNEELYFELKREVSEYFKVDERDVLIVGSAKLGFSISPQKLWSPFSLDSDIDVVIINNTVFDNYWRELLEFNIEFYDRTEKEDKQYKKFLEYFFKGWLRPDKFPVRYNKKQEWFDFFKSISYSKYGNYKINGAIYKENFFFYKYHIENIKKIKIGVI